jgi:hypothetical protein
MCKAGWITLGVGSAALASSIWLILDSRARAEVIPHDGGSPSYQLVMPRLLIGPGVVAGRF